MTMNENKESNETMTPVPQGTFYTAQSTVQPSQPTSNQTAHHTAHQTARHTARQPSFQSQLTKWSRAVRDRDGNRCAVCGTVNYPQAHHILPKRFFKAVALDIDNGICLCPSHHKFGRYSAHQNAVWFAEWLKTHRPEQYARAIANIYAYARAKAT